MYAFRAMRYLALAILFLLTTPSISNAGRQGVTSAAITGRVDDATGGAIPGASVTTTNLERNQTWTAATDAQGRFRFVYLTAGSYQVRVTHEGFTTVTNSIILNIGQVVDLPVKLAVASTTSEILVTSEAALVETGRTQLAEMIVQHEIDALPLNGRNYLDLALLSPGVSRTNTGNNERFAETSAVPGTGISVAGQRNINSSFLVDGVSANDDAADLAGTFYAQEVIREFQVVTSGGLAEFGRSSSGIVNVLTQSGSNAWNGRVYGFFRNHRFDATNVFAPIDPATGKRAQKPLTQGQYGASMGGPLKRDRVFLFSNFEQERLHRSGYISISPANAAAINGVLGSVGYPASRVVTGDYPTGDVRTSYFAKSDLVLKHGNRLALRYNFYDISSPNSRNAGGLSSISRGTRLDDRDHVIGINDLLILPGSAVNETRLQYVQSRLSAPGNDLLGPAVNISGVASFGASTTSPTARDIDMFQAADTYSRQAGAHFIKLGGDFIHNRVNIVFPGSVFGTYSFSSLGSFLTGSYNTFTQAFGKTDWLQSNPNLAWFAQDEWKARRDLTINAGLRQDVEWLTAGIHSRANFSPRLGVAYAPGNRKTVVRAGIGQYFDRIPLRAVANALRGAGVEYKTVSLQRTQLGAPRFPDKLSSFPTGALFNLATIDPKIKNASSLQANLQLERELPGRVAASIGYLYVRGEHIIMQRNLNAPSLTAAEDPVNLGRPNPGYGNITQYSGQGDSYYNGMTVSIRHNASRWASARVSYTLSKAIDNAGNAFFSSPQNNFSLRDERGLSDNDQRHRLTVSGQLSAKGFQLSPILTYASAYPFNVLTGSQTIQTTPGRPAGVGRNTAAGFDFTSLDVRLSRRIRLPEKGELEIIWESFNVLNRTNSQFPNATFGSGALSLPSFGKPTAAADPRQIQFGLRISL